MGVLKKLSVVHTNLAFNNYQTTKSLKMRVLLAVVVLIAPILADLCDYRCKDNGGCTSKLVNKPAGYSGAISGSCFPDSFGGECFGIPDLCSNCNVVATDCAVVGNDEDDGTACKDSRQPWKCRAQGVAYCTGSSGAIINCRKTCGLC